MIKKHLILSILFLSSLHISAQDSTLNTGFGIGFHLSQYQNDFGLGINLTSPCFANDHIAVRLRGNVMWLEHIENFETTWTPYSNFQLGIVGFGGSINNFIRLYGEGGVIGILPDSNFSSNDSEFGGYGLFGFEFFFKEAHNYFIELGGVGTGAQANKVLTQPIYSNGFMVNVGYRYVLK